MTCAGFRLSDCRNCSTRRSSCLRPTLSQTWPTSQTPPPVRSEPRTPPTILTRLRTKTRSWTTGICGSLRRLTLTASVGEASCRRSFLLICLSLDLMVRSDFSLFSAHCGVSGCEECNSANPSDCPLHGPLHPVPNRPVLSKARASLPQILYIDRFLGGVFCKRRIPKRTQFGPIEAPLVPQSALQDCFFHLKVSRLK